MSQKKLSEVLAEALKNAKQEEVLVIANGAVISLQQLEGIIEELKASHLATVQALEVQLENAQNSLASSADIVEELSSQLEKQKLSNPNYRPTADLGKLGHFRINHPVRLPSGEIYAIEELAKNIKLVTELVKGQSTAVTKLTEEEIENL